MVIGKQRIFLQAESTVFTTMEEKGRKVEGGLRGGRAGKGRTRWELPRMETGGFVHIPEELGMLVGITNVDRLP